jgi:hypothetical protein
VSEDCGWGPATEERVSRPLVERAKAPGMSEDCGWGPATEERVSRLLVERARVTL